MSTTRVSSRVLAVSFAVAALALGGQGCGKPDTGPSELTSLAIAFTSVPTSIGQTVQATATGLYSDNTAKAVTSGIQWTSSNLAFLTVSSSGLVTVVGFGTATISGTYLNKTGSKQLAVVPNVISVAMTGSTVFTQAGETSQLTVTATLANGSTADISNLATWQSIDKAVATVSSTGLVTAVGLGTTTITMFYGAHSNDRAQQVTVTPAGTFIAYGSIRHPGHGPMSGGTLVDTVSGLSTVREFGGGYAVAGLTGTANLLFTKAGFEPAQVPVTGSPGAVVGFDLPVQPVIRVTAGQSTVMTIAPNDRENDVSPGVHCTRCLLLRLVSPGSGTAHLKFTWNKPGISITVWIAGQSFTAAGPGPLEFDVPVDGGEIVFFAGASAGTIAPMDFVTITATASFAAPENPGDLRASAARNHP